MSNTPPCYGRSTSCPPSNRCTTGVYSACRVSDIVTLPRGVSTPCSDARASRTAGPQVTILWTYGFALIWGAEAAATSLRYLFLHW